MIFFFRDFGFFWKKTFCYFPSRFVCSQRGESEVVFSCTWKFLSPWRLLFHQPTSRSREGHGTWLLGDFHRQQTSGRQLLSFTSDVQEFLTLRSWVSHITRVPSNGDKKRQSDSGFYLSIWDSRGNQRNQHDSSVSTNHESATIKVLLKSPDS